MFSSIRLFISFLAEDITVCDAENHISIATDSYLRRHRLIPLRQVDQVLDVGRLRTLPKLI